MYENAVVLDLATSDDLKACRLDLADLLRQPFEPPKYVVERVLEEGDLVNLAARPGTGKTWFCLDLAIAIADPCRTHFMGFPVLRHGPVVYLDREARRPKVVNRIRMLNTGGDTAWAPNMHYLWRPVAALDTDDGQKAVRDYIQAVRPALIVFDSFVRFHSQDENGSKGIAEVGDVLLSVSRDFDAAVLVIDHTTKASHSDYLNAARGSSDKAAQADRVWFLDPDGKDRSAFVWRDAKNRDGEALPDLMIRRRIADGAVSHEAGLAADAIEEGVLKILKHVADRGTSYRAEVLMSAFGSRDKGGRHWDTCVRKGYLNPAGSDGRRELHELSSAGATVLNAN